MKSLEEIMAIKEQVQSELSFENNPDGIRVLVGMATCGISAGARPVLNTFVEEVANAGLTDKIMVTQTGCIGICQYEPVVEIYEDGKEKVTYVKMTADKAKEVVEKHLKGGKPVAEYLIGNTKL